MVSTQASQLRITQRQADTGWVEAAARLEREDFFGSNTWVAATARTLASVIEVNSRAVQYSGMFERTANWRAVPYRIFIGDNLIEVSSTQRAGEMHVIKPDGATYTYPLEYNTEGYLVPVMMYYQKWQFGQVGDRIQVLSNFNIV